MTIKINKTLLIIVIYLLGGVFTQAYVFQRIEPVQRDGVSDYARPAALSVVAGVGWPFYWTGRLAFDLTKVQP